MKIILITRHFPPEPSGGSRRPYLTVQELRKLGHHVTVITPFETEDPQSIVIPHPVNHIAEARISHAQPKEQASVFEQIKGRLREWLLWPEPDIRWSKRVQSYLISNPIKADWIITTHPPESVHLIGEAVKKASGAKWLAEARDTWFYAPHRSSLESSPLKRFIEKYLAQKAFAAVDALVSVSKAVETDILALCPDATPSIIIGHFSEPFSGCYPMSLSDYNIVHTGGFSLSDRRRRLRPTLEHIERLSQNADLPIALYIAGPLSFEEVKLCEESWSFKVILTGAVSLEESRAMQNAANALLLVSSDGSHALPGKYAEYRMAGKPILYLGSGDWLDLVDRPDALVELSSIDNLPKALSKEAIGINSKLFASENIALLCKFLEDNS